MPAAASTGGLKKHEPAAITPIAVFALKQADDVLCVSLQQSGGVCTGQLTGPPVSDQEKSRLINLYAQEHGLDLQQCHAYGDSYADLPMLETVGVPHAVSPDSRLKAIAGQRGWPVLDWK